MNQESRNSFYAVLVFSVLLGSSLLAWGCLLAPQVQVVGFKGSHVVSSGDTLWRVAVKHYPELDPREAIHFIKRLNNMDQSDVYEGQVLDLPLLEKRRPRRGL